MTAIRLYVLAGGVAVILALALYVAHLRKEAAQQRALAVSAQAQSKMDTKTAVIADTTAQAMKIIVQQGEKEIQYVQTLPGADTPIDADRRAGLCAALERMRDGSAACDPERPGELPSAL